MCDAIGLRGCGVWLASLFLLGSGCVTVATQEGAIEPVLPDARYDALFREMKARYGAMKPHSGGHGRAKIVV